MNKLLTNYFTCAFNALTKLSKSYPSNVSGTTNSILRQKPNLQDHNS